MFMCIMSVRLIELSVEDEHEVYSSPVCDCRVDEISDTVRGPKAPYYCVSGEVDRARKVFTA